ncbi:MAG: hypothetical protein Q9M36_00115 [Sulfurovum sp.]|nr:hypothetical protein [Sulfurovum sp.]
MILRELDFSKNPVLLINVFFNGLENFSAKIGFALDIDFFNYYIDEGWSNCHL